MRIDGDHLQRRVPEQFLESQEIDSLTEAVGSEGVPEFVCKHLDTCPILQVEADAVNDCFSDGVVGSPQAEEEAVAQGVLRALSRYVPPQCRSEVPLSGE